MEVHKHPHHVTHKKKWGEYLLEFFMLFLAVFLGFVAENVRETSVEHRVEKEYIESMLEDLKTDSAKLSNIIPILEQQSLSLDSLTGYLYKIPYPDSIIHHIYYLQRLWGNNYWSMPFTRRTINQLQNAGGMHLIRNRKSSNIIINYYEAVESTDKQSKSFVEIFQQPALKTSYSIFDGSHFIGIQRTTAGTLLTDTKKYIFLTNDFAFLKNYANQIQMCSNVLRVYLTFIKAMRQASITTMNVLQKEYHLEN